MTISARSYNHDTDFMAVRDFIAYTFFQKPTNQLWIPSRFENSVFHDDKRSEHVHIWLDGEKIVGVVVLEPPENIIFVPNPEYSHLVPKMIQWGEHSAITENDQEELEVYVYSLKDDDNTILVFQGLGYSFLNECEHTQLRNISDLLPESSLPDGFIINQIGPADYDQYVNAIKVVFNHDHFTHEVFAEMRKAKFYKDDLLLGVFDGNGTLAAFAQQRIDEYKIIEFEPVGTLPKYRRMGLAKSLMRESFIRAEKYNPKVFYVGGAPTEEADRLYASVGFTDMRIVTRWTKEIRKK